MQVIFIHHSCFLVEVDDLVLIFDYFGGDRVNGFHFTGKIPDYAPDTKIYMLKENKLQRKMICKDSSALFGMVRTIK